MKKLSLEELGRPTVEEFQNQEKHRVIVILDNVRSALNVGSFFRTCDAFAIEALWLTGITATPPNREIQKTAIGATESVTWKHFGTTLEAVQHAKDLGYYAIGIEQTTASKHLNEVNVNDRSMVLVFGNEVNGVSEEVFPLLDECWEIPQSGTKHSLNVSVCGGIVLWFCVQGLRKV